jgi:polar amino acid transport system permease protein
VSSPGAFAREQGPVSATAVASGALGLVAVAVVWTRALAVPLGIVAVGVGLHGMYQVATYGYRGRSWARLGLALGVAATLAAYLWGAQRAHDVDLGAIPDAYFRGEVFRIMWPAFLRGALRTIELAALAEVFGVVLGLVLATLAISRSRSLRLPAKIYIDLFRGTPLLMQLIVIGFGLPFLGIRFGSVFVPGVIGLTLNSAAYVAEIFRAGIQSIERGQLDAARSLGMPGTTAMIHVVIPQAVRRVIPPLTNEFIALLKDSSLVSVLGATIGDRELLRVARDGAAFFFNATPYMMASLLYLAMTIPLTRVVNRMEGRLRAGQT